MEPETQNLPPRQEKQDEGSEPLLLPHYSAKKPETGRWAYVVNGFFLLYLIAAGLYQLYQHFWPAR